jgi:hypothetical protein
MNWEEKTRRCGGSTGQRCWFVEAASLAGVFEKSKRRALDFPSHFRTWSAHRVPLCSTMNQQRSPLMHSDKVSSKEDQKREHGPKRIEFFQLGANTIESMNLDQHFLASSFVNFRNPLLDFLLNGLRHPSN